jgi:hypothetical protein
MGVSPMTELANNLCDTSLGITPILDSKVSSSTRYAFGATTKWWILQRLRHRTVFA